MKVTIGNSQSGGHPIKGQIEELETFNYPLSAAAIQAGFVPMKSVDDNLNGTLDITEEIVLTSPAPFMKLPFVVTGVIEAEQFDQGGPEVAYHSTASNPASTYRPTGLLITNCTDMGSGYCLENLRPGDWMKYTLDVRVGQTYAVEPRVSGVVSNTLIRLEFFTNNILAAWATNDLTVAQTNWANLLFKNLFLPAGTNVMKISVLTNGFTGAALTNPAVRLNYTSVYPSWNEGVADITNVVSVPETALTNASDWISARANALAIQEAIDLVPQGVTGTVVIPAGTYYVATIGYDETSTTISSINTALVVGRSNLRILGNQMGSARAKLIAYNRGTTILGIGATPSGSFAAVSNVSAVNLEFEGRPHLVSVSDMQGGYTNYFELGAFAPSDARIGSLCVVQGANPEHLTRNVVLDSCKFVNGDRCIALPGYSESVLITSNVFSVWDGQAGTYTGAVNAAPEPVSTLTAAYAPWSPAVFGLGANNQNIVITHNAYSGNPSIVQPNTNYVANGADGFVWFQAGGNWFIARNAITNYALEGVQVNSGPSAIVQNQFHSYIHVQANCALCAFANWPSPTSNEADDHVQFVANSVYGGRNGILGSHAAFNENDRPTRIAISGNRLHLFSAFDHKQDLPAALAYIKYSRMCQTSGNILLSADRALVFSGSCSNAVILANDFSAVGVSGIVSPFFNEQSGVASARNTYGRGKQHHWKADYLDGVRWFSKADDFVGWPDNSESVPPVLDPLCSPVHVQP